MRAFLIAGFLLAASSALAETASPQQQIELLIGNLIVSNTNAQYQLSQAQQQVADLKKQLEEAGKPAAPKAIPDAK